jgi:hypothetical protein
MKKPIVKIATGTLVGLAAMTSAQALNLVTYSLDANVSNLSDIRRIGAQSIPEVDQYTTYGGSLDPTDPKSWPILDKTYATLPGAVTATYLATAGGSGPNSVSVMPVGIEQNYTRISGTVTIDTDTNTVKAASLTALDRLSFGTYQSETVINDAVSSDPSVNGSLAPFTATPLNLMTWTYTDASNALGKLMSHQAGGGTAATSSNIAGCIPLVGAGPGVGTGISGQCRQLIGGIDANGDLGAVNINNSVWNWTGVAANYVVKDATTVPWFDATNKTLTVSGAGGIAGIVWDLSQLGSGIIKANVASDALTGNSAAAVSGTYTLTTFQVVPVPAAVWLFGSALGLLGVARRRAA